MHVQLKDTAKGGGEKGRGRKQEASKSNTNLLIKSNCGVCHKLQERERVRHGKELTWQTFAQSYSGIFDKFT